MGNRHRSGPRCPRRGTLAGGPLAGRLALGAALCLSGLAACSDPQGPGRAFGEASLSAPPGDQDVPKGSGETDAPGGEELPALAELIVRNDHGWPRRQTVEASCPFAQGTVSETGSLAVDGHPTAWRILQRWGDRSIKIAQAQFTADFAPHATRRFVVRAGSRAIAGVFRPHAWVRSARLALRPEVIDDYGVRYDAEVRGGGQLLHASELVRTRFWRLYLRSPDEPRGIGRDFLTARLYLTEYRDMPLARLDFVLGNDYLGADKPGGSRDPNLYPLGPVSFQSAGITIAGPESQLVDQNRHHVPDPLRSRAGDRWTLLRNTWLDDGQTMVWRFNLLYADTTTSREELEAWEAVFRAETEAPLRPLATLRTWQESDALGINGGPVSGPLDAGARARKELVVWRWGKDFGPFGSWGDVKWTAQTGTPRNGPCSAELGHAIQAEEPGLLEVLEGKARRQALRTCHMWGLRVGSGNEIYLWNGIPLRKGERITSLENLGRKQLYDLNLYAAYRTGVNWSWHDHGWNAYDQEHFTTDLLFDYYTVSGSFWARDELRMLGQCLKGLMRLGFYFTSAVQPARAEGWTMQSFVQCYVATGDEDLKRYALRRINEVVEPKRLRTHPSRTLTLEWDHSRTGFPSSTGFFMPWQHAMVAYGYLGAYRFFGSKTALRIAEDVVYTVQHSAVFGYRDPKFGFVDYGLRYYVPAMYRSAWIPASFFDRTHGVRWGDNPRGGAHAFLIGALYRIAHTTEDSLLRAFALFHARELLGPLDPSRGKTWSRWNFPIPDALLE